RAAVVRNLSSAACIKRSHWVSALILAPNKEFEAI
ncbi:YecA family protein, partial [Shigella flexneri]|nr:YecA family protein [Shigella flexneri]